MKNVGFIISAVLLTATVLSAELMQPSGLMNEGFVESVPAVRERLFREVPDYSFSVNPLTISPSWYDYFPGNYHSIPIRVQPSPAGIHDGGGIYIIYQARLSSTATRKVYYVYIEEGEIESGPSLLDLAGTSAEGFPGIDIDWITGNPFAVWHRPSPANPQYFNCSLSFDQYNLTGIPGNWNNPYGVINNPYTIDGQPDQEFIWPSLFIGPSPNPGQRRIFITGRNYTSNNSGFPCENIIIAFADFTNPSDLSTYNPNEWTHVTIPQMNQWRNQDIRPFQATIVSRDTGIIAVVGHTTQLDSDIPHHPDSFLFVLENDNYGEGPWTLFTGISSIPVVNPDNYFIGDGNLPFQDMRYKAYVNRHNAVVDDQGDYHFVALYNLATEDNTWFPNMTTTKHVKFKRDTHQFIINDLYPRNDDGSFYLPWNVPPQYGPDGFLITEASWPIYWYDTFDVFHENYHRIIADGPRMVALFQESIKARHFHEYGDNQYAAWANVPETYIMISGNYGESWSDPIILNSIDTPELAGMIPAYWYMADHMEHLNNQWYRLHLMFFDQNDYGSFIQGNGPNTGGTIKHTSIDIDFSTVLDGIYLPPENVVAEITADNDVLITWEAPDLRSYRDDPELDGFLVYRFLHEDLNNEDNWLELAFTTGSSYLDTTWETAEDGLYRYGVKAVYDEDFLSAPTISNWLGKGMTASVIINIDTNDGSNAAGALVTLSRLSPDPDGYYPVYSETAIGTVPTAMASFDGILSGNYDLEITLEGYQTFVWNNLVIQGTMMSFVTICEILYVPFNVVASVTNEDILELSWAMTDNSSSNFSNSSNSIEQNNGTLTNERFSTRARSFDRRDNYSGNPYQQPAVFRREFDTTTTRDTRALEGYIIYRFLTEHADNEALWVELTTITNPATTIYTDTGWIDLTYDFYQYAVKAIYTGNLLSLPAFSNIVEHGFFSQVSITLTTNSQEQIPGALIVLTNQNENPDYVYTTTSQTESVVLFTDVWQGVYTIEASLQGFANYLAQEVAIMTSGFDYEIVLIELLLPVQELTYDIFNGNNVLLTWSEPNPDPDSSERALLGYKVTRNDTVLIEDLTELSYLDIGVPNGTYVYGVSAQYTTGESAALYTEEIIIMSAEENLTPPLVTELKGNYPNPFNPETGISFSLHRDGKINLTVYNIKGQKIRTLIDGELRAGNYSVVWDGKDGHKRDVVSGIYLYRIVTDSYTGMRKMLLLK